LNNKFFKNNKVSLALLIIFFGWCNISIGLGVLFSSISLTFLLVGFPVFLFGILGLYVELSELENAGR
jgi:hypothetical protein